MVSNGVPDMQNGSSKKAAAHADGSLDFDANFTPSVVDAMGSNVQPRVRELMASLIKHIHDFARENNLTADEYSAGVEFINAAVKSSAEGQNTTRGLLALLGMEALLDEVTFKSAFEAPDKATASTILGPFWRKDAPRYEMGDSIVQNGEMRDVAYIYGRVTDASTGKPVENAELDIWQASLNGLYEHEDSEQPEMNLRGRFTTGPDGKYAFYALRPTPYQANVGGYPRKMLNLLDRHDWRPAHIHFIVSNDNYRTLVTQIYDRVGKYLESDAAFGVRDGLLCDFIPRKNDPKAEVEAEFDFKIVSYEASKKGKMNVAVPTEGALPIPV